MPTKKTIAHPQKSAIASLEPLYKHQVKTMVQQLYSREQLEKFSISELRAQCDRLSIPRRRSKTDCINDILAAQPQLIAQAELEQHIEEQAHKIAPEQQRLEMNSLGYQDAIAGHAMQSSDPCYRVGFERGLRDVSPKIEDSGSQAIVFEKVADGRWQSTVNGVLIRIAAVKDGYKTNLTDDAMFIDFGIAIKESLVAVARLQPQPERPALEVFTTSRPKVYAVYSHKPGLEPNRYEVDLNTQTCTCPHYEHRHEQEGFRDKHIQAVKCALNAPLLMEEEMLLDKPFDELTYQDWERLGVSEMELIAA